MVTGFPSSSPYLPPCTIHFSPFATPALTLLFLLILLFLSFLPSSSPFYLPPPVSGLPLVPQALYNSINTKVKKSHWPLIYDIYTIMYLFSYFFAYFLFNLLFLLVHLISKQPKVRPHFPSLKPFQSNARWTPLTLPHPASKVGKAALTPPWADKASLSWGYTGFYLQVV